MAQWERGKLISGRYFFYDNLEYVDNKKSELPPWEYCTNKDRSFYTEILKGLRPDGKTLITNDIRGPTRIPEGTYDIGDGYYDPVKRVICEYDSSFKRDLAPGEELWILEKCRYCPQQHNDDTHLDGSSDPIVREMIKLNQNAELRAQRAKGGNKLEI